jgi:hypothetical protein
MKTKNYFKFIGTALVFFFVLTLSVAAETQCAVKVFGPFTLVGEGQIVRICLNNLRGTDPVDVGVASYSTFDTSKPIDLQFRTVEPRKGLCMFPELPPIVDERSDSRDVSESRDVMIVVGVNKDLEKPFPLIATAQKQRGKWFVADSFSFGVEREIGFPSEPV